VRRTVPDDITPDGSPVAVYLRLPAGDVPAMLHAAMAPGATVLDLGCGVGRLARPLDALGHRVTGVDESAAMLAHAHGIDTVHARIEDIDLGRRFGAVLAASHLINAPDPDDRTRLLAVCRRHLAAGGVVLVERHPPGWCASAAPRTARIGDVEAELHDIERRGGLVSAAVTYRLGGRSWTQRFTAADVDDDALAAAAGVAGLEVVGTLDAERTWVALRGSSAGS
jgi:SAM-dependent methyltransferase